MPSAHFKAFFLQFLGLGLVCQTVSANTYRLLLGNFNVSRSSTSLNDPEAGDDVRLILASLLGFLLLAASSTLLKRHSQFEGIGLAF